MRRKAENTLFKSYVVLLLVWYSTSVQGQAPVANFIVSNASGCSPFSVSFTDQSTGNPFSWNWDFGNGQLSSAKNPSVTYSQPGTYTVKLVVKNSYGVDEETKTNYITVFPSPSASFSANITTACVPATIQFTDRSTTTPAAGSIVNWSWDFGDGSKSNLQNPSHTYTSTGFYTVSLIITSSTGCKSSASIGRYIRIVNGVDANFSYSQPTTCTGPFSISLQDQSSGPGTLSYLWVFGNGSTSSSPNPVITYPGAGTYPVQLTVNSTLGCSGSITKNVIVSGKTTDFGFPSSICIGQTISFQNNSSPAPVASFWSFGDGTNSSQINPSKTFLNGGTYQVKLVNDYGNCQDSVTKTLTVITQPGIDFSANDSTSCNAPFAVNFTDKSPAASTWLWDFGDGTSSNQQNPSHTYTTSGFFDVTLTITLPGGCSNTIRKPQFIKIKPTIVSILNAPAGGCIPFTYRPVPITQSVDSIVTYSWDLGEPGAIYNTQLPSHTYNSAGNYTIKLTVTTQTGCQETISIPDGVMTGTKPTAAFSYSPNNISCASVPIQFNDHSTTTIGANVQWNWDFGDSSTSNEQNPVHIYTDTGSLIVQFIIANNGCRDTTSQLIKVLPPVANFGYSVNCTNRTEVTFIDSSLTNPANGAISYSWDFGDGATSSIPNPTHSYPSLGTYTATLTVTNGSCSYQIKKPVQILNQTPDFTVNKDTICKSEPFTLTAIVSNPNTIRNYTWMVGSNTINDTTGIIESSMPGYGNYDVTLTIEDINGCTNSKTIPKFVTVSGPVAKFSTSGPGACVNNQVSFNDQSTPANGPITQWTWSFGDGILQSYTSSPFTHAYSETGSYTVSLMIRDSANCADTFTVANSVLITRPVAEFKADTFYCPLSSLQFVDTSTGSGLNYNWDFGDGGFSSLQNPTHSYPSVDTSYTVKLKITDLVGCQDSITKSSYIHIRRPQPSFDIMDSAGICLPLVTTFTFKGNYYKSFYWDFGDGVTSTAQNPSHFYNSYGTYDPVLYLIGPGGCVDSAKATVNVYNPVSTTRIQFNPSTACNSLTSNFNITTPPGFKFKFYFGDGTVDTSQQTSVSHFYSSPGNYYPYVILSDRFGCDAGIGSGVINVYGALPVFDKDKKEFCDNGEVFFINYTLHNDPIISSTWDFGDGTVSTDNDPSHVFSSPGTYIVKLTVTTQNQCTSSFSDTVRVYKTPELSISGKDTVCINSDEVFAGVLTIPDSTITWQWNLGNGSSSQIQNPNVAYSNVGDFTLQLIAKNKLGCADTAFQKIAVVPLPTANPLSNPVTIISGASAPINMEYKGPIISYEWQPVQNLDCATCPQPIANPQFSTDYHVEIQDRFGCKNSANVTVKVICNGQNFFIPNTFSPNGDGVNDVFYLRGTGLFRIKSLIIFNRWGEMVFENREFPVNDPAAGWNGYYKGKKAKPDVYVYQIEIICSNGETIKYAGNIALIQ